MKISGAVPETNAIGGDFRFPMVLPSIHQPVNPHICVIIVHAENMNPKEYQ